MAHQVLGIDFGTSFSSVCVLFHKERIVVGDELGNTNIPSVVCFGDKEKVGAGADHFKKKYPKNTIYEIKRVVGCRYDDAVVTRLRKVWPFTIVEGTDHRVQVELYINNKRRRFFPEYVISKILRYLVGLAENATGETFESAVITVPANFNDTQRQCIRVAARFANLKVLRILDEPVAAAVAISIQTNIDNSRVLVYDLGGGTFDFTILEVSVNDYRVIATDGDPCLGGADFTNALTEIARQKILRDENINSVDHPRLEVEIRNVCDSIKQELSSVETTSSDLDLSRYGGSSSYILRITRREFEVAIDKFIERTIDIVKDCLITYSVEISTVSGIALVGGSSYIPLIRTKLKKAFPTLRILDGYDPREVVCKGALEQAISLVDDVESVETYSPPVSPPPVPSSRPGSLSPSNQRPSISPVATDEDATPTEPIQENTPSLPTPPKAIERPAKGKINIHTTTPLDLGIRVKGRKMSVIIPRNSPLPAEFTKTYQPNEDHPDILRCCMYQGNSPMVDNNVKIGIIYARDIPVYDGIRSFVNITFSINEEGMFSAKAKIVGSSNEVKIEMLDSVLLTDSMINAVIEDNKKEEEAEKKKHIEELASTIEMRLVELEGLDDDNIYDLVDREREWLYANKDTASVEDMQACLERLKQ